MDKDIIIDKLQDLLKFIAFVAAILAIAYFSGFLKGFTPADFQDAFAQLKGGNKDGIPPYNNYQPSRLSNNVVSGANTLYVWKTMFASNRKAVLYVYDSNDKQFNSQMQAYIKRNRLNNYYNVYAYTKNEFKNIRYGEGGPTKICNSLDECKEQRQRAADYTAAATFLERCGKTMCVINPRKRQYVKLQRRDGKSAAQMLNALRGW